MSGETRETIAIPYGGGEIEVVIPGRNLLAVLSPNPVAPAPDALAEIRRALAEPIGSRPLREAAAGAREVVILADDLTRQTPVHLIIPELLDELTRGGVRDEQVTALIALGTHRAMTEEEIAVRFGPEVTGRVRVINNPWWDLEQMADLGVTPNGTPIVVSRRVLEADFVIGLGSIVPHHIPGFSAGAKIVQPGVSGAATTGATHYFSTRTRRSYLGEAENPVRHEMERIADEVGLSAILNTVLDSAGRVVQAFYGDPRAAFRAGVAVSCEVYGVPLPGQADIVIAGSHPCDIEFWQAHKALYPADIAVREGGTVIVVTPCPEGVSVTHQEMLGFTALPASEIEALIEQGTIADVVSGGLALAWAKMRERERVALVSGGIGDAEARALGFTPFATVDCALAEALGRHGPDATVTVLTHAPELLPILAR
ncbi:MAG TPA: nickel-dependent lactate racemase [Thermomicrobiaceae bacterium]|nr:nickel-dependent lactate racemase [Thermomicrobiaceae bacterium]